LGLQIEAQKPCEEAGAHVVRQQAVGPAHAHPSASKVVSWP
jgi:hypothetical protein